MAKELILLSKRKYEELLKATSANDKEMPKGEINEGQEVPETVKPVEQSSTQIGNGMYVEKTDDDAYDGTPGILDHPPKKKKKKETN